MALDKAGYEVVIFDNLSTGHEEFMHFGKGVVGDLADKNALTDLFDRHDFAAVMHFAAHAYVGESVFEPAKYYRNNVVNTLNLLEVMKAHDVGCFIFSSTCATYGDPVQLPITETHPQNPVNPYGRTKLAVEWMLRDFDRAYGMKYCALRYFNAAGAAPQEMNAGIGEIHTPETHLIPLVLQAALDPGKTVKVFGTDYDTRDGSCIRDYVHVCDLADAHILSMERLFAGEASTVYNLGNGDGYSVKEVIDCAAKVTGRDIAVQASPRREGDPATLVGNAEKARHELGWKQNFSSLDAIIGTAWDWEQSLG
ncbi:UDP-glucose 4-epimerase GalE [Desulfovibrio sp. OttesenSCG-928-I05]|nr:UDP-glucose 4-epimerase GalE [Desulfovibrio sp. OttesenSCG-928-I05]